MAYFSNGTEGDIFDCENCKYKDKACPIFAVQFLYNYDSCNNETARKILDTLVQNGKSNCEFYEMAKEDLFLDESQLKLF